MRVKAIASFEHGCTRRRDDEFDVSDKIGKQLADKGLVRKLGQDQPDDQSEPADATGQAPTAKPALRKSAAGKG